MKVFAQKQHAGCKLPYFYILKNNCTFWDIEPILKVYGSTLRSQFESPEEQRHSEKHLYQELQLPQASLPFGCPGLSLAPTTEIL